MFAISECRFPSQVQPPKTLLKAAVVITTLVTALFTALGAAGQLTTLSAITAATSGTVSILFIALLFLEDIKI